MQNEAFDFIQKILQWRKGKEIISKGKMIHYMPTNGLYVYQREYKDKKVIIIMNGNDTTKTISMTRYAVILKGIKSAPDIISGEIITLSPEMTFAPRALYILEIN